LKKLATLMLQREMQEQLESSRITLGSWKANHPLQPGRMTDARPELGHLPENEVSRSPSVEAQ
jgi:hypothetical protein